MVTVIGLGFVGLTAALGFAEYGHKVYGIDADPDRLDMICSGKLPFFEPGLDEALVRYLNKSFYPTKDLPTAIADSEAIYFCVGTPYGQDGQADLTDLFHAIAEVLDAIKDDKFRVLVVKSTIPPTTTNQRILPFLQDRGIKVPEQLGLANNPEFLREGHSWEDFIYAERVVLGVSDQRSEALLRKLYAPAGLPIFCVSPNTGEFIKYLSNTSLACLISFANEMSMAADAIGGIDTAAAFHILHLDKRWQTGTIRNYFYPGCGYGGYCLPKDTSAFYMATKNAGFDCGILKNVISTNTAMPQVTAQRIALATEGNQDIHIGILGLSFNPGSNDVRDTPSAKIIAILKAWGYSNIWCYDPVAVEEFRSYYSMDCYYTKSYEEILEKADIFAITTAWPEFKNIRKKTEKPVVDCRYML